MSASAESALAGPVAPHELSQPTPPRPNVLVVEDNPSWRNLYQEILDGRGYTLNFAVSYGEARGWLQRVKFVVAIVDLNLASSAAPATNQDGFYLLRAMQQQDIPAIVVSALSGPAEVDRAFDEFGVFAFIEKEAFDRRAFGDTVADALRSTPAPPPSADSLVTGLTDREQEVLTLLTHGYTNREIAEALLITPNTVKKHVDHILQKLGVSNRAAAVAAALRAGLHPGEAPGPR